MQNDLKRFSAMACRSNEGSLQMDRETAVEPVFKKQWYLNLYLENCNSWKLTTFEFCIGNTIFCLM